MRTAEALAVLTSLRPHDPEIVSELGERGDAAYLHLALTSGSGHWAVVSSPGDRWFSMEVDGGFSLDHFEEGTPDEDMTRILRQYTEIALEYLHRRPRAQRRGVLRMLAITVSTTQGDIVLRRSVTATLKSLAGSRSQR